MSGRIISRAFWWSPSRWPWPHAGLRGKGPQCTIATDRSKPGLRNDPPILRFRLVVFVLVQKPGDLSPQRRRIHEIARRSGRIEKLALKFCRQRIPLHDDGGAQAAKNTL